MGSYRIRFFLLAFLAVQATAEKCKPSTCFSSISSPLFSATSGQQYTYDFESTATAQLINKDQVETSVSIKGQALVIAGDNCGYSLQLKGVTAYGSDNSKLAIQKDFNSPVQFTLSGDELSPEICADASEGTFSLNVKRGVISALQSGLGRSSELDIFGKCPVTSSSSTAGGVTTITSTKDLDQCAYREKITNGLIQGVVSESSDIKTSPILNGQVESEAKFQNGALQSIELKENYNFLPFSTQNHGARAKVITKLNLKNTAKGQAAAPKTPVARTLLFESTSSNLVNPKVNIKESIKAAFGKTLHEFTGEEGVISSKSAATFAEIIRLMRLAKRADLLTAYQDMKKGTLSDLQKSPNTKAISRSIFLDALFRTGTGDSVAALADLAKKELNEKEQLLMFLSFNLVQTVNKEAITGLAKLFSENLPKEAYLSIGSVVNKFCRDRGCDAGDVKIIADKFVAKIPKDCVTSNKNEEEQLVAVLKGIRNSQTILNSALDRIVQCASNKNPNRVRVAALQAFTANPCNKRLQQAATTVLKNRDEDSEVRIEAYLAAVECPSGALANDVQALLDSEPINQVGSFINTHLDSIKASTDPKREATRAHFKNLRSSKRFPFDPRRYSFNREISYAIDSLGLGSAIDKSVIYSQQSFLPRSAKLNVTGNLFGSAFNILEVSARQENLESLLEHYFGPRGVFRKMSKQDLYDAIKNEITQIARHKRALPEDLAAFDKNINIGSSFDRQPDLDLSVKVFGSELYFLSMSQNIPATPTDFLKLLASEFSKGTDALKNFKYNFENYALWLDSEFVYPTALGLPFKFSSVGSSAVKVDLSGSIDVKQLIENPLNSKVQLQLSPAANIFISGQLGFSAYAYDTALEVAGTIYTNTGANTTIEIQGGKTVVVTAVPTVKDQYIIDLTHQISTVSQESGREAVKVPVKFKSTQDRETELCFDQAEFLTGFTFCTHILYTPINATENAHWPLHGNNKFNIKLEMVDAITFRGEFDDKDASRPAINLYYDTPKDGKPRQTSLKFLSSFVPDHLMGGFDLTVPVQVESPFNIDASAGLLNKENEKKIYLHGNYLGGSFKYELGFRRKGNEIEPILKFNSDMTYLEGKILEEKTDKGVKYTLKQVKFGRDAGVTVVDGSIEISGPKLLANLKFQQGGNTVNLVGSAGYQQGQLDSDLELTSAQYPTANGKIIYGLRFSDKNVGNDLVIVWDKDLNSKTNRLEWNQAADWSDRELFKTKNALSIGKFSAAGKFNGEFGKKIVNIDAGLDYGSQKAEFKLDNKYSQKVAHDFDTSIYAAANQKSIKIDAKREIVGDSSKISNKLELSTGLRLELNGKIAHKFECTNADVALLGVFVPGPKKEQTKATFNLKNTEKEHSASSKVIVGKNEFANWESKLTYGNNMAGSLKASVSDTISADGTFQSSNGKGTANINASIKDRKVKADTQFTIQKPKYDLSTDIFYDYANDQTKKVHFSTNNNIEEHSFDSKNEVEIFSERYAINVNAKTEGSFLDGKQKAGAEIQLPTGRKLSFTADREAKMENKKGNGHLHFIGTDELPNKQQRQAILDVKVNDFSPKDVFFDSVGSLKYRGYDNKDLKVQLAVKNLQKGHFSTANVALQVDGQLIPDAATLNINVEEYCENHAIYSLNGKYGNLGDINANGKFYVATKERPHSHDFNGVLNLPNTKLQKIVVSSNGQLTEPADPEGSYIVKYSGTVELAGKKVAVDTDVKASRSKGSGSAKLQLPDIRPISVETSFSCNQKDKADGSLLVKYGANKKVESKLSVQKDDTSLNIDASVRGDLEQIKDITFQLNAKRPSENEISAKANLKADDQQYNLDYEHRLSTSDPKFAVVVVRPQGTSKIIAEAQIASQLKGKGSLDIENIESFDFKTNIDGDLTALESFHLTGDVDSPKIGLKKFTYDIRSKAGAAGRAGFDFKFTNDGKHYLSGSTDFTTKLDKGRTILEGKSIVKLTDGKSDEVSFKLIRNIFELPRDGEVGFGGIVNVFVGPRNFAGELKLTNKEFHTKYTSCETKNRCTNLEIKSVLENPSFEAFKHNLVITVDLREVGFSHEFGLKADTSRDGWKFQHSIDAYLQAKDKPEYQYSLFINPTESGALLSLPTRQVALDATYKYPVKSPFGVYDGTIAFYVDKKNKPRQKTALGFRGELKEGEKKHITGKGDLTFEHPRFKKLRVGGEFGADVDAMDVKSKLEFDIFSNPSDAVIVIADFGNTDTSGRGFNITSDVEISSKGLGLNLKYHEHAGFSFDQRVINIGTELTLPVEDFRFGLQANVNDQNGEFFIIAFNQEVLKSIASYDINKFDFNAETTLQYIGSEPVVQKSTITGLTQGSFTLHKGKLIDIDSGFGIGTDIHLLVKGSGKEIFNGKIALDASHFLNTNYHIDEDQMKEFTGQLKDQLKQDYDRAEADVRAKLEKIQAFYNQKLEKIQKASPDFAQLQNEYQQEVEKLIEELKQDPAIKKLIDQFVAIIGELAKTFNILAEAFKQQYATIDAALKQFYEQSLTAFNENILPEIKKLYASLAKLVAELYEQTAKLLSAAFERIAKALKAFEDDFNKISVAIRDATSSTYEAISQYIKEISQELKDLCETLRQTLQTLPGLDYLKEKYAEYLGDFSPIETLKVVLAELVSSLAQVVPAEIKPVFDKLSDYVQKKIAGEVVDDLAFFKELYTALIDALNGFRKEYVDGVSLAGFSSPINLNIFKRLPPFITNVRFSVINQLGSEPLVTLRDLVYLYRPYAFNPIEAIPPFTLHGELSDGAHIFTFDGRHLTFPGKCSYILARDFVEGNFSVVANFADGKLKSISLTDKSGYAEISNDAKLQVEGKGAEYPFHQDSLHAWRNFHTLSLLTTYGASVECSDDLRTCHVRVSGFYSGKLRGLLGNGNNEPYDDYLLPNGKITESTSELGNAYRTRQDCEAVTVSGDEHPKSHTNEFCTQYFSRDSSLRLCFLFINPANYREACEHATHGAADAKTAACGIATTYASRCRKENIPVSIPKACSRCSVGTEPLDVGDSVAVKVPQKQADVVVAFDIALGKDLSVVQEVVNELKRELKNQGFTDIQIASIGYSADDKYLYQYTTDGKLDFKGNFANVEAKGFKEPAGLTTGIANIDTVLHELEKTCKQARADLGFSSDARAFQRALNYPFRPTATKTILAFRSDGIPYSANPAKIANAELTGRIASDRGIGIYAVLPITITEPADRAKNIVGFNNDVALLLNEKKRPNMGSVDIAGKLKYEPDLGVDLTKKYGYVFNLNSYQTDKKKFVGVVGYVLADVISRTEVQSECTCELASGLYPETRCKSSEQKLLAPAKKAQKGR